jgi:hypothetical protein
MTSYSPIRFAILALAISSIVTMPLVGQDYITGTGTPTFTTALPAELGFVDASNGNLHLEIPITSPPQRGPLVLGSKLAYDGRVWSIVNNGSSQV